MLSSPAASTRARGGASKSPPRGVGCWTGEIAANAYWLSNADVMAPLPQATFSYYRRHRIVPTLVVHLISTAGMTDAELQAACGGLDYPPTLVRPYYAFQRKPADVSTAELLARLPRE